MLKYLKKYWLFAILAPLFMVGEVLADLVQPRLMSTIVDEGVLGLSNNGVGNLNLVLTEGLKMIIFVILGGLSGILCGVCANIASQNFGNDLRKDIFKNIMSFSFEQTDKFSTGSLITRVTNDITQLQNFIQMSMRGFIRTFMLFAGGIICMLSLNLSFGAVIACALPLVTICVIYFLSKANPLFSKLQQKLDNVNNVMQENVSGFRVVKAYVKEDYEKERFGKSNDDLVNTQLNVLMIFSYMQPIMNIILNLSVVAVIKVGGIQVANGSVTPGNVMAAITYVTQSLNAVMRMTNMFQTASRGIASGRRINEVLACEPSIKDGSFNTTTSIKGKIEFKNVTFAYPLTGDKKILDNINLVINPGETIGILGETGCGKTSLINLIPRFYDVTEGSVLVDDIDVREYNLKNLRERISVALQKSEIFQSTIKENIRWGRENATDTDIANAASIAQAVEFISTSTDGFDTLVTQQGTSLSGGQKQRLSIARAIAKHPDVYIFDDSFSALDYKTDATLRAKLKEKTSESTVMIVAQRISTILHADQIIVLDDGQIVGKGTHKELLKTCEAYYQIASSQLSEKELEEDLKEVESYAKR